MCVSSCDVCTSRSLSSFIPLCMLGLSHSGDDCLCLLQVIAAGSNHTLLTVFGAIAAGSNHTLLTLLEGHSSRIEPHIVNRFGVVAAGSNHTVLTVFGAIAAGSNNTLLHVLRLPVSWVAPPPPPSPLLRLPNVAYMYFWAQAVEAHMGNVGAYCFLENQLLPISA